MAQCPNANLEPTSATLVANELATMHVTGRELKELARQTEFSHDGFVDPAAKKLSSLASSSLHYDKCSVAPACTSNSESILNDGYIARAPEKIRKYRIWSAYNVLCGCLLFGIVALIMSSETAEMEKKATFSVLEEHQK